MENSPLKSLKPSQNPTFTFPPHRRRPLQSETYRTFVRIMSHCNALQSHLQHRRKGEVAEENKLVGVDRAGKAAERNELLDHDPMEIESLLVPQKPADNSRKKSIDFQGGAVTGEPMEGDLLDRVDIIANDNNSNTFMRSNQTIGGVIDCQKDGSDVAEATEVSITRQGEVEKQYFLNEVPEAVDSSLEMDMVAELSRSIEDSNEKNSSEEKTVPKGIERELQLKEQELEKLISTSSAMDESACLNADDDIEEGEISGDIGVYDEAMEFLFDDAVSLEENKAEEPQINKVIIDKEEKGCDGRESGLGRSISASSDIDDNGKDIMKQKRQSTVSNSDAYAETLADRRDLEIQKVDEHKIVLETGEKMIQVSGIHGTDRLAASVKDLTPDRQVTPEGTTENGDLVTNEKDNGVEKKKRKKGPLSKERKAKKKKKERIKRAEKNRKLGVKRLKLQPVVKPKTVTYCRHYLKGRCQEGEKCKFSHDTTPLTKSKPCCHFARHSCMKGDDCPFDHQLSKYPCNNYVTKGFCVRGADCLFSHVMAEKEGSLMTSNVPKPEFKSLSQTSDSNSKKQVKIDGNPPQNSSGNSTEKKVAQYLQRPATGVPKGISVLSPFRLSPGDTNKHEQAAKPLKGDCGVKIGPKMRSSSSDSGQKSNDITKTMPLRTPKGINFLSFGKAPLLQSGSNNDHGVSSGSFVGVLNESTLFRSPVKSDGGAKTENQCGKSSLESESNQKKMANTISSASGPQGIKFLAFGKVPGHNSSAIGQVGLLPNNINSGLPLVQERENALGGLKFSNEMPCGLASSSNPFCQSTHQSGPRNAVGMSSSEKVSLLLKTPSSVTKALQSTLAFAAKYDSEIKLDQQIGNPAVSTEINQQSSSS